MSDAVPSKLKLLLVFWFVMAGLQVLLSIVCFGVSLENIDYAYANSEMMTFGSLNPFWTIVNFVVGAVFVTKAAKLRNWARIVMLVWAGIAFLMAVKTIWEFVDVLEYNGLLFGLGLVYALIGFGLAALLATILLLNGAVRRAFKAGPAGAAAT